MFLFGQCPRNLSSTLFLWKSATSQLRFSVTDSATPLKLASSNGPIR